MSELNLFEEANRQLVICNACRYCEGLCPVFRAIETRRDFVKGDVFYLANLCHDCRACYYACMFTPPHEFAVNIPRILSEARLESYKDWSWPQGLARAFSEPSIAPRLAGFIGSMVILSALLWIGPSRLFARHSGPGSFYQFIPYLGMVTPAVALFLYGASIWFRGVVQSWSATSTAVQPVDAKALWEAIGAAVGLKHLGGGGPGCTYPKQRPSASRRLYHSFVFWGFLADFISTSVAFIYQDIRHILPPYPVASVPVIFGVSGGILLILGTGGLIYFKWKSDREPAAERAYSMDYAFLVLLGLSALTGMLTLIFRQTTALGSLLVVHLATIAALFITAPYGKFVHFLYRTVALVRYYAERRQHASG